ncbi:MAG TPA: rhodanese-like domain-containing protein [Steroidobacteraceae bacterium]|nr:rhodanese-like domain-containing protein [Steroidobacteraceae bacterium]
MGDYILLGIVVAYFAWRLLSSILMRRRLPQLRDQGAQLVDVRGPAEFAGGHAPGSVNIPLQEIGERTDELDSSRPVVVCCASGTRSAMAAHRLRRHGFKRVINAGSWRTLA